MFILVHLEYCIMLLFASLDIFMRHIGSTNRTEKYKLRKKQQSEKKKTRKDGNQHKNLRKLTLHIVLCQPLHAFITILCFHFVAGGLLQRSVQRSTPVCNGHFTTRPECISPPRHRQSQVRPRSVNVVSRPTPLALNLPECVEYKLAVMVSRCLENKATSLVILHAVDLLGAGFGGLNLGFGGLPPPTPRKPTYSVQGLVG